MNLKLIAAALLIAAQTLNAHEGHGHDTDLSHTPRTELKLFPELKASVRVQPEKAAAKTPLSGSEFWRFRAVTNLPTLPSEAIAQLKGAHGTIVWDKQNDTVYWGLQNVGWIAFSNHLQTVRLVAGDPKFAKGNLHGADLLPRAGKSALIAAADDAEGEIYLSDTTFQYAETLGAPNIDAYKQPGGFRPTDVAFTGPNELKITDGYGKAYVGQATVNPFQYNGDVFGGKKMSQTPHGVTRHGKSLLVAARPEAAIVVWNEKKAIAEEVLQLPAGSTVCDVDIWEDYALAPCLDGPSGKPGPIYIVNLKKKTIASVIRPKEDLGFSDAQHIHDAAWYTTGRGKNREVYILFTNWNPGGFGALKLSREEPSSVAAR